MSDVNNGIELLKADALAAYRGGLCAPDCGRVPVQTAGRPGGVLRHRGGGLRQRRVRLGRGHD